MSISALLIMGALVFRQQVLEACHSLSASLTNLLSGKGQSSCAHVYSLANTVVADVLGPLCILQMKKRHINDKNK